VFTIGLFYLIDSYLNDDTKSTVSRETKLVLGTLVLLLIGCCECLQSCKTTRADAATYYNGVIVNDRGIDNRHDYFVQIEKKITPCYKFIGIDTL
jgi:hypothetical protein